MELFVQDLYEKIVDVHSLKTFVLIEIQLEEINRLEKQLNEQVDVLLGFVDNAYSYFQVGTFAQKRKIIEIISEKVSYKDKTLNIELKPIFQSIVENQYNFSLENSNNRTLKNGTKKGLETDLSPKHRKNSPGWTRTNNLPVNSRLLRH